MTIKLKYLILVFLFFVEMPSNAQYHKKLKAVAEHNNMIGMSVAVFCKGKILDIYHYGLANIERNIQVNDSTLFRIASISKTVTTAGLMKLYERGLFKLDDDISDYLGFKLSNPYYPGKTITFRMLLTHTSSLLDGEAYDKFLTEYYQKNPPPPLKQLLTDGGEYYNKNIWNNKEPGSYFTYCNLNFGITGTLIEKISGERFDKFIRKEILQPLGIQGSFNACDIPDINKLATLYRNSEPQADNYRGIAPKQRDLSQYNIGDNGIIYSPQAGFKVSVLDLSKFMIMLMNFGEYNGTRILDSTTVELMHSVHWKYNGNNGDNYHNLFNEWGLGFHLITNSKKGDIIFKGVKMIGHAGDAYGLISDMYFDESRQFGFIFITNGFKGDKGFSNSENSAFYKPEAEVFEIIKKHLLKKCLRQAGF